MQGKKGQFLRFGALDSISAVAVLIGVILIQKGDSTIGWLLVVLGILKQFSGR